jgi:hypothetical protein
MPLGIRLAVDHSRWSVILPQFIPVSVKPPLSCTPQNHMFLACISCNPLRKCKVAWSHSRTGPSKSPRIFYACQVSGACITSIYMSPWVSISSGVWGRRQRYAKGKEITTTNYWVVYDYGFMLNLRGQGVDCGREIIDSCLC